MTRAEKYLSENPDAEQEDGIPYETPESILCAEDVGFSHVTCIWDSNPHKYTTCVDCWKEEAE